MAFPSQKIVTYYKSRLPPRESLPLNTCLHITSFVSQTGILGNSGRTRELDEMIPCGPWVPSNRDWCVCTATVLAFGAETIAVGQPMDETHFDGDQISPGLPLCVWVQRVLCWSSSGTITVKPGIR